MEIKNENYHFFLIVLSTLLVAANSSGQDSVNHQTIFPRGVAIDYGLGHCSVRDEYISKEKYSGTLPYFAVSWSRFHNKYGFRQKLEYRSSSEVRNYNISTDIIQFSLHRDYLYPVGKFTILSKDIFSYLGPSTELFLFYNKPNFVEGGIHINYSFVLLISGGFNSEFIVPLQHGFQVESSVYLSLLSVGLRTPEIVEPKENEDEEESVVKLLTPFTGMNSVVSFGARYYFFTSLSMKLAYKFQLTRIRSWDPLLSVSDNLILSLTYHI
jgi:hypothetical protein